MDVVESSFASVVTDSIASYKVYNRASTITDTTQSIPFLRKVRPAKAELISSEIIAFPIMISALVVEGDKDEFSNLRRDYLPKFQSQIDNFSQYAPAAVMLGMKLAGVEGRSSWGRMLTADAFSAILMASTVNALKYTVKSKRPDGTTRNSFPSGHTATAFMTATMIANEYGWRSPIISICAYSLASVTGFFRMANNRHWLSDVLFGAGVGVLSTQMGYFITDLIYGDRGLNRKSFTATKISKEDAPSFFGIYMGYDYPLGRFRRNAASALQHISGGVSGFEGAYFFSPNIGIGGRITAANDSFDENVVDASIDNVSFLAGSYFSLPISKNWSVGSKALAGVSMYPCSTIDGVNYDFTCGVGVGTGLSLTFRLNKNYNMHLFCDYNIYSPYKPFYSSYMHHVAIGGSTSISF
jgi:hypothetical protein